MDQRLQAYFGESGKYCFGCGLENERGIKLSTYLENDEGVTRLVAPVHLQGWTGFLQGGVIATLMDCTMMSLVYATACKEAGIKPGDPDTPIFVTVNSNIDYLKPTPVSKPIELRARISEFSERKMVVTCSLFVDKDETARGKNVMVRVKEMKL